MDWHTNGATGLERAIAEFKYALPGWWFMACECQVSCDASCAPTTESEHIDLIAVNPDFDSGFHVDIPQPATLADALRNVMGQALRAIEAVHVVPSLSTIEQPGTMALLARVN